MMHGCRKTNMTYQEIDALFPFIVFAYGALLTFVLNNSHLMNIAQEKFPSQLVRQMNGHRILAIVCLFVGSFWSLQSLWLN